MVSVFYCDWAFKSIKGSYTLSRYIDPLPSFNLDTSSSSHLNSPEIKSHQSEVNRFMIYLAGLKDTAMPIKIKKFRL